MIKKFWVATLDWLDSDYDKTTEVDYSNGDRKVQWIRCLPFLAVHLTCFLAFWVGVSPIALFFAGLFYFVRMFAITGVYHRYFSHTTYKTSRFFQFLLAVLGATTVQRGALWWASHHRHHHLYSDTAQDVHSPRRSGFWWSHIGWIMNKSNFPTDYKRIPDFAKYPELVFLNRFDLLVPVLFAVSTFVLGSALQRWAPSLGTSGGQMLIWAFFISTVALFHGTFTINSLSHLIGRVRFDTGDDSKNSWFLAIITMGEGWHNNHHYYQASARQGFYWWEYDVTYYILKIFSWMGLVWDLRPVPQRILDNAHKFGLRSESAPLATSKVAELL